MSDFVAARLSLADVRLHAPVLRPPKILGIGLNYADHARETNQKPPEVPLVFNKQVTATSGPFDAIVRPRVSQHLDYEGELGFVIRRLRDERLRTSHVVGIGQLFEKLAAQPYRTRG